MRNLKKVLALVLVVATLASICLVGASAAYSEETLYPEAAAVVKALGIIEGYEDGTMQYDAPVTREQAAKIICYALLGKANAEALKTTTAPFADVAATRWSAGYIAYLKAQGIISGVTDTEFAPTAGVSGIAFAKMLLAAVGYGAKGEFEGAAWDINTITLANDNNILVGTKAADLTAAATREECMLYAFNTIINAPVVKYNATFDTYYWGNNVLDATTAKETKTLAVDKFKMGTTPSEDAFGRPTVDYTLGGVVVAKNVKANAPAFTFENAFTGGALYTKLGKTAAEKVATVVKYEDGKPVALAEGFAIADKNAVKAAEQGAKTEVYVSDNGTKLTLVTVYEYIADVTKVDAKTGVVTFGGNQAVLTGVAVKDVVVYTKGVDRETGKTVFFGAKATPVTGAYTDRNTKPAFGAPETATIGGKVYAVAAKAESVLPGTDAKLFGVTFEIYADSLGNILRLTQKGAAAVVSSDYLYIQTNSFKGATSDVFAGNSAASAKAQVVYGTGKQEVVELALTAVPFTNNFTVATGLADDAATTGVDESKYTINANDAAAKVDSFAGWYTYTKDEAGKITLISKVTPVAADKAMKKGVVAFADYIMNANTVINVIDNKGGLTTYTGYANLPQAGITTGAAANVTVAVTAPFSKVLTNVYVYTNAAAVTPDPIQNLGYCLGYVKTDATGNVYKFLVNGAEQTVNVATATTLEAGKVYNLTTGPVYYTAALVDTIAYAGKDAYGDYLPANVIGAVDAASNYFTDKAETSTTYFFDAKTVIYDAVNGGTLDTLAAGQAFICVKPTNATLYPSLNTFGANYCSIIWVIG